MPVIIVEGVMAKREGVCSDSPRKDKKNNIIRHSPTKTVRAQVTDIS